MLGGVFMIEMLFIFSIVFVIYYLFWKLYIICAKFLKQQRRTKNNYIVKHILLSSGEKLSHVDLIVVLLLTYLSCR